ncbi:hypothetical protein [Mycobacterium talmoniae]|uniref:Uncharacterized protein n=1 Tax=Mycobacterium talmoniae TaxID=1858794 RepID=A0A1S1NH30_9MYCO|nr:hypothetical protein [Mycobacterium talmoniae]OHV03722.1 hypothetical protein BKN37_13550 [Mycobacterium talmoniae]
MRSLHLLIPAAAGGDLAAPYHDAEQAVWSEVVASYRCYPRVWASADEGAMLLAEEVDELWDEVRGNRVESARAEAVQAAAMAVRFIADLCECTGSAKRRCQAAAAVCRDLRGLVGPAHALVSTHEGFGFVRREYDTLWSAVTSGADVRIPAARVAAMAVRFIAEVGSPAIAFGRTR